jgi:hypothetical protein
MTCFERLDGLSILQSQADVVQAIEQAMLAEGIDFKVYCTPSGRVTVCAARSTVS